VDSLRFRGFLLPALTIAIPIAASMTRVLRANLLSEMKHDYVFYARARGLSTVRIAWKHMLPNALPPIITMLGQYLGAMVAGSAIVENIFSLKGIGTYLLGAVTTYDLPAISGCVIVVAFIFLVCNTATDVLNTRIAPRIVRTGDAYG
jgi:peptide/nickel transport system permease protein/nickel transport system permease protein